MGAWRYQVITILLQGVPQFLKPGILTTDASTNVQFMNRYESFDYYIYQLLIKYYTCTKTPGCNAGSLPSIITVFDLFFKQRSIPLQNDHAALHTLDEAMGGPGKMSTILQDMYGDSFPTVDPAYTMYDSFMDALAVNIRRKGKDSPVMKLLSLFFISR
jgi:hypothetical protein